MIKFEAPEALVNVNMGLPANEFRGDFEVTKINSIDAGVLYIFRGNKCNFE